MAQSGYTPILIYASGTTGNAPDAANLTSSASGAELALNYFDGKLFYKDASGNVQVLATKGAGTIGGSNTQVQYNNNGALAGSANLTFNGTSLTLGGNPTLSAGTANGVTYLNGSKVLTSGSALVFDGSSLGVGIATPSTVAGAWKAIELVDAGNCLVGGYGEIDLANNLKYDRVGGFSYVNTGYASRFTQIGGVFTWNSGTGTAGASAALNTVMQLNASGNLGIGTSSPTAKLHVAGAAATVLNSYASTGTTTAMNYAYMSNTGGTLFWAVANSAGSGALNVAVPAYSAIIGNTSNAPLVLTTNSNIVGYYAANGNYSVGGYGESKANVFSGGSNGFTSGTLPPGMTIYGTAGDGYGSMLSFKSDTGAQGVSGIGAFRVNGYQTDLRFYTNSTLSGDSFSERMRITPAGYVGIGITNPNSYARLTVSGNLAVVDDARYVNSLFDSYYSVSAFWLNAVAVPADSAYHWIPLIGGAGVVSGVGYVTQAVFGVKKYGGSSFAAGAYIGVTNNSDGGPGREFLFDTSGNFSAPGSKSFKIPHPLPEKSETHELWHVALEGPSLDLIYRGSVDLVNGTAEVNIDTVSRMSEGTFVALTKDAQSFTSNESDWTPVRSSVSGNILSIEAQDNTATSNVSWMVIAKRKDASALTEGTADSNGEFITERLVG